MTRRLLLPLGIMGTVGLSLLPFLWFMLSSFKSQREIEAVPPGWCPSGSLEFYRSALFSHHLLDYVGNSVVVAGSTTAVALLLAIPAAYALARLTIPGKQGILALLLCVSMFPQMAIAGPVWRLLDALGGLNHRWGVVLPYVALTLPLAVWILASFFAELPAELEDAARIDGCGRWTTLLRVTLPLAAPGIFTAAILILIYAWNEFFFALLILTQPEQQTLPVGIALFQGEFTMPWGELAAASVIATLPLIAVVLMCQRWIVSGLSAGAVKG
ncbi:MAG: carbohydrate ABC transporter permease [Nitrospira sp.]|nr:MAG: carbohydrate ABC transporter permease [Nitrospira sp.]